MDLCLASGNAVGQVMGGEVFMPQEPLTLPALRSAYIIKFTEGVFLEGRGRGMWHLEDVFLCRPLMGERMNL